MTVAMAAFAIEDGIIKALTTTVPTGQLIILLGVFSTIVMAMIARGSGAPLCSPEFFKPAVLIRNISEITGAVGFITALKLLPLSMASALFQTMPLAITLGAAVFLNEKVGWRRWTAVGIGFAGVVVILRPTGEGFNMLGAAGVMLTVFSLAVRDLATRKIGGNVHSMTIAVWGVGSYTIAGVVLLVFGQQGMIVPDSVQLTQIGIAALLSLVGYYLMIVATRIGEVSAIMPYRYSRLVFALILGWLLFAEVPDLWMVLGSAMIVGSGIYTFLRERYHAFHGQA